MKKQELFNNVTEGFPYQRQPQQVGLYDAAYEHDACGVGMLVNIHGEKSHDIVESALKVLENMRHRGAEGADNKTGDGAGIMLQIPHEFILLQGIPVPEKGRYGTGLLFLPKNEKDQAAILSIIIEEIEKEGLTLMHLRNVPTCPEILGESALANEPDIKQVFITGFTETETADRKLYLIRKRIENKVRLSSIPAKDDFYVVSLSTKSIIYKGMLSSLQLRNYYPDANFTLRLTYGNVKAYSPRDAIHYNYYTTTDGILEKENPEDREFVVPAKLKELILNKDFGRYAMADGTMPVCFLTTNDITGGNSGSPVINGEGQLIGCAFDGNWESLSGDINFDNNLQRCIALDIRYVLFILEKLGDCGHLIKEMNIIE